MKARDWIAAAAERCGWSKHDDPNHGDTKHYLRGAVRIQVAYNAVGAVLYAGIYGSPIQRPWHAESVGERDAGKRETVVGWFEEEPVEGPQAEIPTLPVHDYVPRLAEAGREYRGAKSALADLLTDDSTSPDVPMKAVGRVSGAHEHLLLQACRAE